MNLLSVCMYVCKCMTVSRNYGGAVREVQVLENLRGADLDVLVNTTCSICHHMFVCMYVCMYVCMVNLR